MGYMFVVHVYKTTDYIACKREYHLARDQDPRTHMYPTPTNQRYLAISACNISKFFPFFFLFLAKTFD